MFLSKNSITLLSSIGASSIPVVSVVALYKIKSFSLGNNLEEIKEVSQIESAISIAPEEKKDTSEESQASTEQTESTPKNSEPEVKAVKVPSPTPAEKKEASPPGQKNVEEKKEEAPAKSEDDTQQQKPDLKKVEEELKKQLEDIINSNSIEKKLEIFISHLETKKSSIGKDEQSSIEEVITAFKSLKSKIDETN